MEDAAHHGRPGHPALVEQMGHQRTHGRFGVAGHTHAVRALLADVHGGDGQCVELSDQFVLVGGHRGRGDQDAARVQLMQGTDQQLGDADQSRVLGDHDERNAVLAEDRLGAAHQAHLVLAHAEQHDHAGARGCC